MNDPPKIVHRSTIFDVSDIGNIADYLVTIYTNIERTINPFAKLCIYVEKLNDCKVDLTNSDILEIMSDFNLGLLTATDTYKKLIDISTKFNPIADDGIPNLEEYLEFLERKINEEQDIPSQTRGNNPQWSNNGTNNDRRTVKGTSPSFQLADASEESGGRSRGSLGVANRDSTSISKNAQIEQNEKEAKSAEEAVAAENKLTLAQDNLSEAKKRGYDIDDIDYSSKYIANIENLGEKLTSLKKIEEEISRIS